MEAIIIAAIIGGIFWALSFDRSPVPPRTIRVWFKDLDDSPEIISMLEHQFPDALLVGALNGVPFVSIEVEGLFDCEYLETRSREFYSGTVEIVTVE